MLQGTADRDRREREREKKRRIETQVPGVDGSFDLSVSIYRYKAAAEMGKHLF